MGSKTRREKEYKSLPLEIKDFEEEAGSFSGYLARFNTADKGDDVICPGAFTKTIAESKSWAREHGKDVVLPILFMHDRNTPLGGFTDLYEDEQGLFVKGFLDISTNDHGIPNNAEAVKVYSGMLKGFISSMSIGYYAIKKDYKNDLRYLRECALFEGSAVVSNLAMHPEALVTGVKSEEQEEAARMRHPSISLESYYRVAQRRRKQQKSGAHKDFASHYQQAQAADCLMDWYDLTSSLKAAMTDAFTIGDQPLEDAKTALEQFASACLEWVQEGIDANLSQFLADQQVAMSAYSDYMRDNRPHESKEGSVEQAEHKAGMTFSKKNRDTIAAAVGGIKEHAGNLQDLLDAFNVANTDPDASKSTPEPDISTQAGTQPDTSTATAHNDEHSTEVKQDEDNNDDELAHLLAEMKALMSLPTGVEPTSSRGGM